MMESAAHASSTVRAKIETQSSVRFGLIAQRDECRRVPVSADTRKTSSDGFFGLSLPRSVGLHNVSDTLDHACPQEAINPVMRNSATRMPDHVQ